MELRRGSRVLEVGCGTGRNLAPLIETVGPEGQVYGVDLSYILTANSINAGSTTQIVCGSQNSFITVDFGHFRDNL